MSGEFHDMYVKGLEDAIKELINASKPFLSPDIVDETSATIPLIEQLEAKIVIAEKALEY